jgi:hypothetical protein
VRKIAAPLLRQYSVAHARQPQLSAAVGQLHRRSRNDGRVLQVLTLLLHARDLPQPETPILETAGPLFQMTTSRNLIPNEPPVTTVSNKTIDICYTKCTKNNSMRSDIVFVLFHSSGISIRNPESQKSRLQRRIKFVSICT